jgi:tRNA modification GTPase
LVREGALVVLAGAPNVGKSSLFNALLGQSRAIVTDIPGTTRDAIEAVVDTPRVPLRLVDTAGMRDATDVVERIGVEVSAAYVARAAVVLACGDSAQTVAEIGSALAGRTNAPVIAVWTKADLDRPSASELDEARAATRARVAVAVSAETGEGLGELLDVVARTISATDDVAPFDAPILTHERHRFAVSSALEEARLFRDDWASRRVPVTIAAVHLRAAVATLEDLVGAVDVEDVLDELFRRFCVGK